jgi:alpha-tubulin suppressor-like RCC1 family protein
MKESFNEVSNIHNERGHSTNILYLGDPLNQVVNYLHYKGTVRLSLTCKFFYESLKKIITTKAQTVIVASSHYHTLVYRKGTLYGSGRNQEGQLGLGHKNNQTAPQVIRLPNQDEEEVISIVAGEDHTIVSCTNSLYSFGDNTFGQLGLGKVSSSRTEVTPQRINLPPAQHIAAGHAHTIVSCSNQLYGFGSNTQGELGLGDKINKTPLPLRIILPEEGKIKSIAAGNNHTLVLYENGQLWGFGDNSEGELGLGDISAQRTPRRIILPKGETVMSIATGRRHTLALCKNSENSTILYGFGVNSEGQLGLGHTVGQKTPQPIPLPKEEQAAFIAAALSHSFVLCKSGTLYAFGDNSSCQLPLEHSGAQLTPYPVSPPEGQEIKSVIAAGYFTHFVLQPKSRSHCLEAEQTASLRL